MELFTLRASDGHQIAYYFWPVDQPRAIIQIAHGMGEHGTDDDDKLERHTAETLRDCNIAQPAHVFHF